MSEVVAFLLLFRLSKKYRESEKSKKRKRQHCNLDYQAIMQHSQQLFTLASNSYMKSDEWKIVKESILCLADNLRKYAVYLERKVETSRPHMPASYFILLLTTGRSTLQNLLFPQRRQHATEPLTKLWCIQGHMKQSFLTTTHLQIDVVEMSTLMSWCSPSRQCATLTQEIKPTFISSGSSISMIINPSFSRIMKKPRLNWGSSSQPTTAGRWGRSLSSTLAVLKAWKVAS